MVAPAAHREAAAHLRSVYGMSERRACRVLGVDRASVRYQATRPDDGDLRDRLKALAQERRRFGYRRLHVMLRREGHAVNRKRVQRIYREERLTVRRRGGRKRAKGTRRPLETPLVANQRWSLDFVSDQLTDGRRFRILTVIDDCTRECLALVADTSLSGLRVAREEVAAPVPRVRCAIYVRCASPSQATPYPLADQWDACEAYAARQGWETAVVYKDNAVSGVTWSRPSLDAMMAEAERGAFDVVLVEDLARLSRDVSHVHRLLENLKALGVVVHTIDGGVISGATS